MKWLFYGFVALVVAAVVIIIVKMVIILALVAGVGYGIYRSVQWFSTRKERRRARLDANIARLEKEMEMK